MQFLDKKIIFQKDLISISNILNLKIILLNKLKPLISEFREFCKTRLDKPNKTWIFIQLKATV